MRTFKEFAEISEGFSGAIGRHTAKALGRGLKSVSKSAVKTAGRAGVGLVKSAIKNTAAAALTAGRVATAGPGARLALDNEFRKSRATVSDVKKSLTNQDCKQHQASKLKDFSVRRTALQLRLSSPKTTPQQKQLIRKQLSNHTSQTANIRKMCSGRLASRVSAASAALHNRLSGA